MNEEWKTDFKTPGQEILDLQEAVKLVPSNQGHIPKKQVCFSLNWEGCQVPLVFICSFQHPRLGGSSSRPFSSHHLNEADKGWNCAIIGWPLTPFEEPPCFQSPLWTLPHNLYGPAPPALTPWGVRGWGPADFLEVALKTYFRLILPHSVGPGVHVRWNTTV